MKMHGLTYPNMNGFADW